MTTATRTRKASRLGGVDPLPSELLPLVPDDVRDASEGFGAALDRHRAASRELAVARKAVEAAHSADRHAATEAELAGGKLPKATLPAAEQKVTEAERVNKGARDAAQHLQNQFLGVLRSQLVPIKERSEAELERIGDDAVSHVDAIETLLTQRARVQKLVKQMGSGDHLLGRSAMFSVPSPRRGRDPLAGPMRKSVEHLRRSLGVEESEAA